MQSCVTAECGVIILACVRTLRTSLVHPKALNHMKALTLGLIATAALFALSVAPSWAADKITVGFSQIGAESGWRTANTTSIKDEAAKRGITLKFADAQQKQENQIKALRTFIAQGVDVIAFSPVVETGFEPVLKEIKRAKIPVI